MFNPRITSYIVMRLGNFWVLHQPHRYSWFDTDVCPLLKYMSSGISAWLYGEVGFSSYPRVFQVTWICKATQVAKFMGPTRGPSGADGSQVGPILAPPTLLLGCFNSTVRNSPTFTEIRFYVPLTIDMWRASLVHWQCSDCSLTLITGCIEGRH